MTPACLSCERCGAKDNGLSERASQGGLIVVVGPSGAGKDTLIEGVKDKFSSNPRVHFAIRTITRPAGDVSERHRALSTDAFQQEVANGAFSVTWEANGLSYGLPACLADHVAQGDVVIANGSRGALSRIRAVFPEITVVVIQVPNSELARRLRSRGREGDAEIQARMARNIAFTDGIEGCIAIDNSGPPSDAIEALSEIVRNHLW